jgi:hemerythrin-like domain-containing protein
MGEFGADAIRSGDSAVRAEHGRLIAWNLELRASHERLRELLQTAREGLGAGDPDAASSAREDLLLHCHGFCSALGRHHVSEDTALFPELAARFPELQRTIGALEEDHERIAGLLDQFEGVLESAASPAELALHLDGLAAIMTSHFRYEERRLVDTLATLDLDADPRTLLG